jgi:hypothetical protein
VSKDEPNDDDRQDARGCLIDFLIALALLVAFVIWALRDGLPSYLP